ncbi:30S ribosome-binding factor RbfA [Mollicutes bacterium LVI A0039]|nr:30S ribosome-binding factor RbfA [Mollicutes bacterium LVI A0039]
MANFKYDRIAEDLKMKLNIIINERFDDLNFVTVVDVELTKDLGDAKVYVQCLTDGSEEFVIKYLESKKGYLKREIAKQVQMRKVPNLIFKYDHSMQNYNRIDELLGK